MVKLYTFIPAWDMPDLSPFCVKVQTYLRMAEIPFEPVVGDSSKAPKRKLPYVEDAGVVVADSRDIIAHFEAKLARPLDAGLSREERALTTAFRGLLEEEWYFYALCQLWGQESGWRRYVPILRDYMSSAGVPSWLARLLLPTVRRQVLRSTWSQGAGRHGIEQINDRMCEVLDAVAVQLGDRRYFLGDEPRTIDATVHAFIWPLYAAPFESTVVEHARFHGNLGAYCERMRRAYFPDMVGTAEPERVSGSTVCAPQGAS